MKKIKKVLLIGLLVVVAAVAITAVGVSADPKEKEPDGIWCYTPLFKDIEDPENPFTHIEGPNVFMTMAYESKWTGAIEGDSHDSAMIIWQDPTFGPAVFAELVVFDSVQVGGLTGGLEMHVDGAGIPGDWRGNWFITAASGDLYGLEGYGEWWGEGYAGEGCGEIYYRAEELEVPELDDD